MDSYVKKTKKKQYIKLKCCFIILPVIANSKDSVVFNSIVQIKFAGQFLAWHLTIH